MESITGNICITIYCIESITENICIIIYCMESITGNICITIYCIESITGNICIIIYCMESIQKNYNTDVPSCSTIQVTNQLSIQTMDGQLTSHLDFQFLCVVILLVCLF